MRALLCIPLVLVLIILINSRNSPYISRCALTPEFCERLIKTAENMTYDQSGEPIDGEPVYQINILNHDKIENETLWNICKGVYHKYKKRSNSGDSMFLKRYLPNERRRIPLHRDICNYTVSFLLSDTKDFEGCEYYMFDKKTSRKLKYLESKPASERDAFIETYKNLPIWKYEQGDAIRFKNNLHGTLPLKSGKRYVLTIFYA